VNFELVAVTSPVTFVVKILSEFIGGRIVSKAGESKKTEQFLEDLQKFEGKPATTVKTGQVYGVKIDGTWRRARVLAVT
jgi:hypothetical protein